MLPAVGVAISAFSPLPPSTANPANVRNGAGSELSTFGAKDRESGDVHIVEQPAASARLVPQTGMILVVHLLAENRTACETSLGTLGRK